MCTCEDLSFHSNLSVVKVDVVKVIFRPNMLGGSSRSSVVPLRHDSCNEVVVAKESSQMSLGGNKRSHAPT